MKMKKLIATIGKSKYYIHGAFTRKEYSKIIFWNCYYFTDLILKGQTYFLYKNFMLFDENEFKQKVPDYLGYTFDMFKADLKELGNPKFIVIYIDQPHTTHTKTDEDTENDKKLMTVLSSCNTGAF